MPEYSDKNDVINKRKTKTTVGRLARMTIFRLTQQSENE